jgi:superfamily II DNA or RNA helicase
MTVPPINIQAKPLRRATARDAFALYRAGLEWGLIDPVIINDRDDLKSEPRWRERVRPFHHQVTNLITYCRRLPVTLLADDVGLGKTISAGLIASELMARRRVSRVLIVAPKLLGPQWKEELETKFNIPAEIAIGRKLIEADTDSAVGAVITTYHTARQYIKQLPREHFEMLILDEAHKLRNLYGVPTPPIVAQRFREVLAERMFRFVLMLTATPIQNRLWDLYSLVDLLTVARGHQNPFGSTGMFARRFIEDNQTHARRLKLAAREEFRSIVYGYMSRVRRGDAQLHFPSRKIFRQAVTPTPQELQLIATLAKPIQRLNRLAQISILQALTSSPDACAAQLENMARRNTFPDADARKFKALVKALPMSAKLQGVATLVDQLRRENPKNWRMVVFTQRRETQTTIQAFLESQGIAVGIINGDTTQSNHATISHFKAQPPKIRVIVSTEAGSEGVNLQAANVLVNYDLPWNPMIVEQRVGRVQRLGSEHAHVLVYSVTLAGTFEDYIVGRLMQKLQMATHAIGDVESLLEAAGMGEGDADGSSGFEDHILKLVLDSLAGKDVEAAARAAEESIERGHQTLVEEQETIDATLGSMDAAAHKGPQSPDLPSQHRSMPSRDFVISGLRTLGATLTKKSPDVFVCQLDGARETISISEENATAPGITQYAPGSPAFDRLVMRLTQSGVHDVSDADTNPRETARATLTQWAQAFGATYRGAKITSIIKQYAGTALLQVRATVAHDSYERLLDVECTGDEHRIVGAASLLDPVPPVLETPEHIGLSVEALSRRVMLDPGIAEFHRFYVERRTEEVAAAGKDIRAATKLADEFTPRLEATIAGLQGTVARSMDVTVTYLVDGSEYASTLRIMPSSSQVLESPPFATCAKSGRSVPVDALAQCEVSRRRALRHLLAKSAASDSYCLPEHLVRCSVSGLSVTRNETELSDATGNPVLRHLLRTSAVSGRKAEASHIGQCAFTRDEVLRTELAVSAISGKAYRSDQGRQSAASGRKGHVSEFISCPLSGRLMAPGEAEICSVSGESVFPGTLEACAASNARVVPRLLEASSVSGRRALAQYMVTSSVSQSRCLQEEAIRSSQGKFCTRGEVVACEWSGESVHPDDIRYCDITGLPVRSTYCTRQQPWQLTVLAEMLNATRRAADQTQVWPQIAQMATRASEGKCTVESAQQSPDHAKLAVCAEQKTLMGLKKRYVGMIYSVHERAIVGKIAMGKRQGGSWTKTP